MERGIEQSMDAILAVPSAILVLMGFGVLKESLAEQVSRPPYLGRVLLLPPVPPEDLLIWTASADVLVMAGVLCDPTSPDSIAAAIQAIIGAQPAEREAERARALRAAHERYNWETQLETLFAVYRDLLPSGTGAAGFPARLPRR